MSLLDAYHGGATYARELRLDATTPAPRNRPEVAPEHLEVDAEISRDGEDSHASVEA
jgi:hypothetical protein